MQELRRDARQEAIEHHQAGRAGRRDGDVQMPSQPPLGPAPNDESRPPPGHSPDRGPLNEGWNVARALDETPRGMGKLLSPLRRPLQRLLRFALGPLLDYQVQHNSAQVSFDNEIVSYLDARLDRMSGHYDRVLGLHGKRMEEIDERHLILQQELIRHVHDLVQRIEFVFETAEQNHLYLEGMLREVQEELVGIQKRLESLPGLEKQSP